MTTFVDQATDFIRGGGDEEELLLRCLEAGTVDALRAVQMMYEDMYGRITFNFEIKAPAALALVRWGAMGLEALVEGAHRTPTSKNQSLVIEVLSKLASFQGEPPVFSSLFGQSELRDAVYSAVSDWNSLVGVGRRLLRDFFLAFADDDDAYMAVGLQFTKEAPFGSLATREIFAALAGRLVSVSVPVIEGFRALIKSYPSKEPRFQAYLEDHPQLLDPMAKAVWPRPDLFGIKEPDFVVERSDGTYLIVEIETPAKRLITSTGQLSAEGNHAVSQVLDYVDYLVQHLPEAQKCFPGMRNPEAAVVVGVEGSLSPGQRRRLVLENHARPAVRIVGFDWLADRAEAIAHNIVSEAPLVCRARLGKPT